MRRPAPTSGAWNDFRSLMRFALSPDRQNPHSMPFSSKLKMAMRFREISKRLDCPHSQSEVLHCVRSILSLQPEVEGCVVEAGCYKGGSTAKFSLAADLMGRELVVFDSFSGIPRHNEDHGINIFGKPVTFSEGEYCGSEEEVRENIRRFGVLETCRFIPGWFEDTMPDFQEPITVVYLDVDLAASTRTCLRHLYPLLQPGGILHSQDGHLPRVIEVFEDDAFWEEEVGCPRPPVVGLRESKLITIHKE